MDGDYSPTPSAGSVTGWGRKKSTFPKAWFANVSKAGWLSTECKRLEIELPAFIDLCRPTNRTALNTYEPIEPIFPLDGERNEDRNEQSRIAGGKPSPIGRRRKAVDR